jgi:hypothetical protein
LPSAGPRHNVGAAGRHDAPDPIVRLEKDRPMHDSRPSGHHHAARSRHGPSPFAARTLAAAALALAIRAAGPATLAAQSPPRVPVAGLVVDSVSGFPLSGALVQVVALDDARRSAYSATTDTLGHFRIDSVLGGRRYAIGFYHESLEALGLALRPRVVAIADAPLDVTLATPSPRSLASALCPEASLADTTGALAGIVHDADTHRPLEGASVVLLWNELVLDPAGVRPERREIPVRTREDGRYVACGVPSDVEIVVRAELGAETSGFVELLVPPMALARRDFGIDLTARGAADSTAAARARVTGIVRNETGTPVPGALVVLVGAGIEGETDARGAYALAGLPSGTYALEVRRIGFAPTRAIVDLARGREARADIVIDDHISVLAPVRIDVRRDRTLTRSGFIERQRIGLGDHFTREEIRARHPKLTSDVLRTLPGVRVVPVEHAKWDVRMRGDCRPQVYIDGMRVMNFDTIDAVIAPEQIAALEIYASAGETPAAYSGHGCGSIVIWTGDRVR